jgi:hypothetical protein
MDEESPRRGGWCATDFWREGATMLDLSSQSVANKHRSEKSLHMLARSNGGMM